MDVFKSDLKIVRNIMDGFLSQPHIKKGLNQISELGITGWEKWWQIELAIYIDEYPDIEEWDIEHAFDVDGRKVQKTTLFVDFGFTMKGWNKQYSFIELKQNEDFKKCIDNMFKDAEKYELLKSESNDGVAKRSVFVVGLFSANNWDYVHEYFLSCMEHYEFDFDDTEYMFLELKKTNWGMLIF